MPDALGRFPAEDAVVSILGGAPELDGAAEEDAGLLVVEAAAPVDDGRLLPELAAGVLELAGWLLLPELLLSCARAAAENTDNVTTAESVRTRRSDRREARMMVDVAHYRSKRSRFVRSSHRRGRC